MLEGFPGGQVRAWWCSCYALAELVLSLVLPPITTDAMVVGTRVTDALVAAGFGVMGLVTVRPSSDRIQHVGPPPTPQTTRGPETFGP